MKKIVLKHLISVISALLFSDLAYAKIYKCKDSEGIINFTSIPCGQKNVGIKQPVSKVKINADGTIKTKKQIIADRLKKEKVFLDEKQRERKEEERKRIKYEKQQQMIKDRCKRARERLSEMYRSNIFSYKGGGNSPKYNDSDIENGKRAVSRWCGKES